MRKHTIGKGSRVDLSEFKNKIGGMLRDKVNGKLQKYKDKFNDLKDRVTGRF